MTAIRIHSTWPPLAMTLAFVGPLLALTAGCARDAGNASPPPIVMIDIATNTATVQPASDAYPAVDPATGKPTLMPAMYCGTCRKWRPVPAPAQINRVRNATQCPRCRDQLTLDGPLPETTSAFP